MKSNRISSELKLKEIKIASNLIMKKNIHTKYPINLKESDKLIFDQVVDYKIEIPSIKKISNVFVTNNGLVLKNGILNKNCALNLISKNDHTFYCSYWKKTLEQFLVCKFGKSLPSIKLDDNNTYLIIHSNWLNYSFWITEYLTRLIRVENEIGLQNLILLYPEDWDNIPYIKESLKAFSISTYKIPSGKHLFIKNLIFPEVRKATSYFYPEHIKQTKHRLLEEAKKRSSISIMPKKIYLTRGMNIRRTLKNEKEVQSFFLSRGYEVVSFENLSIWDQIMLVNNIDIMFSLHGAGFVNVMFMRDNSYVVEFLERDFAYYANPFPHLSLASAVNVNYAYLLCKSDETKNIKFQSIKKSRKKVRMNLVNRNIEVDLKKLKKISDDIESKLHLQNSIY